MDKRCKNCKHWIVTNTLARDFCELPEMFQRETMEFLYYSPLRRELARLAERIGIKSCKYFEAKTGGEEQTGYF